MPIESRVKSWESIEEKLRNSELNLTKLIKMQDLAGLRLILLFKRDVEQVCELIKKNFDVKKEYDTQERLDDDKFGYSSFHFVIKLPESWLSIPTMANLGDLQAEIQVRTLAQHIWAATSHTLKYKQEEGVPPSVRRAINRVSALLETVDLEFERVLEQRDSYRKDVDNSGVRKLDEQDLNIDLLETILDSLLPNTHKSEREHFDVIYNELSHFEIKTNIQLKDLINKSYK